MKSTAKSIAWARDLKEKLEFRGFSIVESKDAEGFPILTLNTDEASLKIVSYDAISKDVFGNDLTSFSPHSIDFASRDDAMDSLKVSKILIEVNKLGIEKTIVKTHATVLATAEASVGEALVFDITWPSKGM